MIRKYFEESIHVKLKFIENNEKKVEEAINIVTNALKRGNKLLICGNGGSAADAQHFASELVGRFELERKGLPAIALTTDSSTLTSLSNDYGFEQVFAKQVEALGSKGDILIAISTSGNSLNVVNAVKEALKRGIYTIGLLGRQGGKLRELVDLPIIVESGNTARIQECHLLVYHIICKEVEKNMFGGENNDNN